MTRSYCEELGRLPDVSGLSYSLSQLHFGKTSEAELRKGLSLSSEGKAMRLRMLAEEGDLIVSYHVSRCRGSAAGRRDRLQAAQQARAVPQGDAPPADDSIEVLEVFDVLVECRASPCEWLRRLHAKEHELSICIAAPSSKVAPPAPEQTPASRRLYPLICACVVCGVFEGVQAGVGVQHEAGHACVRCGTFFYKVQGSCLTALHRADACSSTAA